MSTGDLAPCPEPKCIVDLNWWNSSKEKIEKAYSVWAKTYDQDIKDVCHGSKNCAMGFITKADGLFPGERQNMRILDVGCGTGFLGEHLYKAGFTNLVGLDASEEMLEKAKEKAIYKLLIHDYVTSNRLEKIADRSYDAVVSCGVVTPGQIKPPCFDEMIRWVKKGGLIFFTCRKDVYSTEEYGYPAKFDRMEKDQIWQLVYKTEADYYTCPNADEFSNSKTIISGYKVL